MRRNILPLLIAIAVVAVLIGFANLQKTGYVTALISGFPVEIQQIDCECNSCSDCMSKINDPLCWAIGLNTSIYDQSTTCIDNPENFSNKVFDCQGYTIDGDGAGSSGIQFNGKNNITIKNCMVSDFGSGISLYFSTNDTVVNNTVSSTMYTGIAIWYSNNSIIADNILLSAGDFGSIQLFNSYYNDLIENTISYSNKYSFFIRASAYNNIINNTGVGNSYGMAFPFTNMTGNVLSGNTIRSLNDDTKQEFFSDTTLIEINQTGRKIGYELLWMKHVTGTYDEYAGPAVINDIAYVANKGYGVIFALNATDGEQIWNYTTGQVDDQPTYNDDVVYVAGTYDNKIVYALNATNGNLIWNYTQAGIGAGSVAYWDNIVYTTDKENNILYALNASNEIMSDSQRNLWNYSADNCSYYVSSTTVIEGVLYAGCVGDVYNPGTVYALNATDGSSIWNSTEYISSVWDSSPMVHENIVYIGTQFPYMIYAFDKSNGQVVWNYTTAGYALTPISINNDIVFAGGGNVYYAINNSTGNLLWSYPTGDSIFGSAVVDNAGMAYVTSNDMIFYGLNATDGYPLWTYNIYSESFGLPTISNGKLFLKSDDWYLRVFNLGEGDGNWTTFGHNQSRNAFTSDGVTSHEYVDSICNTSGLIITCNITNMYNKTTSKVILKNTNNISQAEHNNSYIFNIYDDKVVLPGLAAGEMISVRLMNGTVNSSMPSIIDTSNGYVEDNLTGEYIPVMLNVVDARYNPFLNITTIHINDVGTNKNITLNYTVFSNFDVYDSASNDSTPVLEIRYGIVNFTRNNYLAEYDSTTGALKITIPTMSEHILTIKNAPPVRSNGFPSGTIQTTSTTISLNTDELATCRYSTSSNIEYDLMTSSTTSLDTFHSWIVSAESGLNNYYIRCNDTSGNYNPDDYEISFEVFLSPSGGGSVGLIPVTPPPTQPVSPGLTPDAIATFPKFRISFLNCTLKDKTFNIPPEGATVVLQGSLDDKSQPTPGTAAVLLYPSNISANETKPMYISKIQCIEPEQYAIVHCNQSVIASYEVDVTADLSYLCINYEGTGITPESVTINLNEAGEWKPVTITNVLHNVDKKIICGNITGHTPYMVSGFVPKPEILSAADAIDALEKAIDDNCPAEVCTEAETLLAQAKNAYEICDYSRALALANQGRALFAKKLSWIVPVLIVLFVLDASLVYYRKKLLGKRKTIPRNVETIKVSKKSKKI